MDLDCQRVMCKTNGRCKKVGNIHTHYDLVRDVVEIKIAQDEQKGV